MLLDGLNTQELATVGIEHLSVAEFEATFVALSQADRSRLRQLSRYFANRCGGEAEDLLQEALARVLAGRRHCPRKISIVQTIVGVLSSLSSEAIEARKKGQGPLPVSDRILEIARHDGPSPEQEILSRIDGGNLLGKVQEAVVGDEECEMLLEGIFDGMKGAELEALLGIDTKRLAAVQRRLQRKIAHAKAERASS